MYLHYKQLKSSGFELLEYADPDSATFKFENKIRIWIRLNPKFFDSIDHYKKD